MVNSLFVHPSVYNSTGDFFNVCVHLFLWVHMCRFMHACTWNSEVNIGCGAVSCGQENGMGIGLNLAKEDLRCWGVVGVLS